MKVLLCLLSDQHVPNLLSVHHFKPDRLVLVQTKKMNNRNRAKNLLQALEIGGLNYHERHDILDLNLEDNLEAVRTVLRSAHEKYPNAEWIANVTGGTKPMSIAAFEFFKERGGRVVYTNVAKPNGFMDLNTDIKEDCQHRISIKEFLTGYGFEPTKSDTKQQKTESRTHNWVKCATAIAQSSPEDDILSLKDSERAEARDNGWSIQPEQLKISSPALAAIIRDTFSLQVDGKTESLIGDVDKYAVQFLTGGWLEVFFWDMLKRHADTLGLWDVRLGLNVDQKVKASENEFDVAFMHNYGLRILECKSGSQDHDPGTDILYKVEAIKRQFGAIHIRSFLATTSTNVTNKGVLKENVKNRADLYNCKIITANEIRQLANNNDSADLLRKFMIEAKETT
jgi:hypothetical protein